jgi:hypothetical protein
VVVHSRPGEPVYKLITQSRWDKTKQILNKLRTSFALAELEASQAGKREVWLTRSDLESARGFLIYVTRMYTAMVPYLKGPHLMIDSWRPHQDEDGWRVIGDALSNPGRSPILMKPQVS